MKERKMRGFRGFRKPEPITDDALKGYLERTGLSADNANLYVMWTGGDYKRRPASARSQALATLEVKNKPVALADWIREAARCKDAENQIGFDPGTVRSGLFLHQGAKPCVYLALERRADGSFVAAKNVDRVDGLPGVTSLKKGDTVIAAEDAKEAVAQVEARGARVVEKESTKRLPAPRQAASRRGKGK
jgi:hypothetical protein